MTMRQVHDVDSVHGVHCFGTFEYLRRRVLEYRGATVMWQLFVVITGPENEPQPLSVLGTHKFFLVLA